MNKSDCHKLIKALFNVSSETAREAWWWEFSGGFSGAFVAIVHVPEQHPVVMKAGPAEEIEQEVNNRTLYAERNAAYSFEKLVEMGLKPESWPPGWNFPEKASRAPPISCRHWPACSWLTIAV